MLTVDDSLLDASLVALVYVTTRLDNACTQLGLRTVRDLVLLRPADLLGVRNAGRRTVKEAEEALHAHLGVTWAEARAALGPPAPVLNPSHLDAPLTALNPPKKLRGAIDRLELLTVRDLVLRTPKDLLRTHMAGHVTVQQAESAVLEFLGVTWAEARASAASSPPPRSRWHALRERLPARALGIKVDGLPHWIGNVCRLHWNGTVGDLLDDSTEALKAQDALGDRAWKELADLLTPGPQEDPFHDHAHWLGLLRALVERLRPREQWVIERRSGLVEQPRTLDELAPRLEVTRSRVQQIEARALRTMSRGLWTTILASRLDDALDGWVRPVGELGERDAFFSVEGMDATPLAYLVNAVVRGEISIVRHEGEVLASRLSELEVRRHVHQGRSTAASLPFPLRKDEIEMALAERLEWEPQLARDLVERFDGELLREGPLRMGFGRRPSIATILRASEAPLSVRSIQERCGRSGTLPDDVIAIAHGVLTVPEKVPGWTEWSERLGPLCQTILEGARARQWTTAELLAVLEKQIELPAWINPWSLGSILRRRSEVRWLGRNVVTARVTGRSAERIDLRRKAIDILERHRRPMKLEALAKRLRAGRGFSKLSLQQLRYQAPFIMLEDGRVGLAPRDVPDGKHTTERVIRSVLRRLQSKRMVRVRDVATTLGLDGRLVGSILRQDDRFGFVPGGVVRLAGS